MMSNHVDLRLAALCVNSMLLPQAGALCTPEDCTALANVFPGAVAPLAPEVKIDAQNH